MKKRIAAVIMVSIMILSSATQVLACTGTIIGKDVSADGSTLIGRTEDIDSAHTKQFVVHPRTEYKSTDIFKDPVTGFKYPQPKVSYKYTAVPDSEIEEDGIYAEVGSNEYGVCIDATVSASPNDTVLKYDPLVENGLREANIPTIVLPRVKTAKEGIKLVASIVEKQGSAEGNILVIADKNEVWYMEILSGHRYAAIKFPENVAAVFPNCYMLGYVNLQDSKNVIASKDLLTFAKNHGFYKEYKGKFHIALSYGEPLEQGNRDRLWGAQNLLAPSKNISYDSQVFDLFITPDKKVSLKDLMELQRYRYEGTKIDANLPENKTVRPIGTERQAECHIIQLKDKYPTELGGIMWLAMGNAEHSVYLPTYGNINDTHKAYKVKTANYSPDSAYWIFRSLSTLSELDRDKYGKSVREYWSDYEDNLIAEQEKTDKKVLEIYNKDKTKAAEYTTQLGIDIAEDAMSKAKTIYEELFTYVSREAGRPNKTPFVPSISAVEQDVAK
ncbi:C69 family dipeptidase [Sporanaerobacter sp. PP17-6a]|uniref:C69 family dipeptidase n=1 Tax=Sporanaerobacter sp. PP17-6a TaxID=1891289 RepID=UPI0008A035DD|nr:C69 family dipeptidase [Sporanaerobacter sp. PP17-6a]SCL81961.1 Dipeptidase [Sporanaerobacter sp. PP17-6a]